MSTDVDNYFAAIPEHRSAKALALQQAVLDCFPTATVDLKYKMPTYSFAGGWVAIANQKSYLSLYTCGAAHLAEFKLSHPQYKTGKGCINFRDSDNMPIDAVKSVIRHAIEHPKGD